MIHREREGRRGPPPPAVQWLTGWLHGMYHRVQGVQFIFHNVIQPWHPTSTLMHEVSESNENEVHTIPISFDVLAAFMSACSRDLSGPGLRPTCWALLGLGSLLASGISGGEGGGPFLLLRLCQRGLR